MKYFPLLLLVFSQNSYAWKDFGEFKDYNPWYNREIPLVVKSLESQYGIEISYVRSGNKEIPTKKDIPLKELDAYSVFGIVENGYSQEPESVVAIQLREIEKALSTIKKPVRGLEFILFTDSYLGDSERQISMVNAHPVWACQESFRDWGRGANYFFSKEVWNDTVEHPSRIMEGVFFGGVLVVVHAMRTGTCAIGDSIKDVARGVNLIDLTRRGIIFESNEIVPTILSKKP
ncbi:hypothetical protein K2X30_13285 [bacterium]|jgi:hypothetical protein|nr:hypothetical protein [bacterium]